MTSYVFKVIVERDEDRWHAYCPALVERGAATWGETREKALANIEDVVKMVVASMTEHGEAIEPADTVENSREPRVAVTV
jgi:predicted RNase H-like HicB family nuclease